MDDCHAPASALTKFTALLFLTLDSELVVAWVTGDAQVDVYRVAGPELPSRELLDRHTYSIH
jgi:hypothetical protein